MGEATCLLVPSSQPMDSQNSPTHPPLGGTRSTWVQEGAHYCLSGSTATAAPAAATIATHLAFVPKSWDHLPLVPFV